MQETKHETKHETIEGRNPVFEALSADVPLDKIFISETAQRGKLSNIMTLAKEKGIMVQVVNPQKVDAMSQTRSHQGVVALCAAARYQTVEEILAKAEQKGKPPFLILADEITDPHNLGAIIRTANAAGADGVIIPKNRSVGLSAIVAKTSAGALVHTPVAKVTNLVQTMEELKQKGIWVAGADMEGDLMYQNDLTGAIALVIGAEGKGLSRLVKEKCDYLVSIPMLGQMNSLNASVAAGVLMYEIVRQRQAKPALNS